MVQYTQVLAKVRNDKVDNRLIKILLLAGEEAGVDEIRVTSGGQCSIGTCSKRVGFTRHDLGNAADLELWVGGKLVNFTNDSGLAIYKTFVTAVARLGAAGIGAGIGYMGAKKSMWVLGLN
ncbi:hypothetical protein E0H88_14480 [Acinetobacter sp. ANC 4216]|uniref:hypothetical protein n=1 Tax=Acinetobacter sp. ANC 4216 TaxID=2529840 RepID=UPI001038851B|nr:hypothetical protein [Acinetobacter sp. ANC 4216]TCB64858.1 hypothetical protein E0H88_14480 [Acinetobacter sp. ANC 4216]